MIIALAYLVNTVSSYLGIDLPILASITGMSLIPLVFMYISSYVFRFCEYHRMFLHYIAANDIINIYDQYIGIDISDRDLFVLNMSIAGISLFIILPTSATVADVYVAINSQYHDYAELFKNWFGDGIEQKIVESAIVFWFKDADCKAENKVVEYLGEY